MKLTSIPHALRSSPRGIEVVSVLAKYGLAGWINRLDVNFASIEKRARRNQAPRQRRVEYPVSARAKATGDYFSAFAALQEIESKQDEAHVHPTRFA